MQNYLGNMLDWICCTVDTIITKSQPTIYNDEANYFFSFSYCTF